MAREKFFVVVVVLFSIVSCSVKCGVMKITEELSTEMSRTTELRESDADQTLQIELKSLWESLPSSATPLDDMVANDQPMIDGEENANLGQLSPRHEAIRKAYEEHFKYNTLALTNHTELMNQTSSNQSFTVPSNSELKSLCNTPESYENKRYYCEAIPPICPITNEKNLTLKFNLSNPTATSKNTILKVYSAELKLLKIPLKVSDKVIQSKVNEKSMIRVTVYKIRNKNKTQELKHIITKMIRASLKGITSWDVKNAANISGNETRKTLKLVIKVDDGKGNEIPTQNVFEMRCGNDFDKPLPVNFPYTQSEKSHTAWMILGTVEEPTRTEAMKEVASPSMRYELIRTNGGIADPETSLILDDE